MTLGFQDRKEPSSYLKLPVNDPVLESPSVYSLQDMGSCSLQIYLLVVLLHRHSSTGLARTGCFDPFQL